jgi:hypothetical protein
MQSEATVSGILMELQRFQGLVWVMAGMAEKIGEIPRVEPSRFTSARFCRASGSATSSPPRG